jgi:hypothetical protein
MEQKSRTLYLLPESDLKTSGKFVEYSLGTWDVDDLSDYDELFSIALHIMDDILKECIIISPMRYVLAQASKKRFFLPDKLPQFLKNSFADQVMKAIIEGKVDLEYCVKEHKKKLRWVEHYYKSLYVMSRKVDMQLLNFLSGKSIGEDENLDASLDIYWYMKRDNFIKPRIEDYVEDLINPDNCLERPNYAVWFFMGDYHTMLQITLNPSQIPIEILLKSIESHVHKHNFDLEVNI